MRVEAPTVGGAACCSSRLLEGNGVALVRERELARKLQRAFERLYLVEPLDDISDYVHPARNGREELLVREDASGLSIAVLLPELASGSVFDIDGYCQLIEGVSHFVLLADRAREGRHVSALELEAQAEVDKFAMLLGATKQPSRAHGEALLERLFDEAVFMHDADSELGNRYRDASALARRWVERVGLRLMDPLDVLGLRTSLRAFFRAPLEGKFRLATTG